MCGKECKSTSIFVRNDKCYYSDRLRIFIVSWCQVVPWSYSTEKHFNFNELFFWTNGLLNNSNFHCVPPPCTSLFVTMMKRRFKRVMSYFFNFDSIKTPKKKSRKAAAASTSRDHLESESQYVIRRLSEGNLTPRENVSFSRYTPLPRIGETAEHPEHHSHHPAMGTRVDTATSHIITYKFSPVQVRAPAKVSYQLSPLPVSDKVLSVAKDLKKVKGKTETQHPPRTRLKRQDTYIVTDPVIIKGTFLEYLKSNDNMVTTRVHPPEKKSRSTSKRGTNSNELKHSVAKVSNSKQRLSEIKAKFKRQQEEMNRKEGQGGFWLEL